MSIKDILEIWSLNHFRMSMKDIFGDLEPQSTVLYPKLLKFKQNMSFRIFGAKINSNCKKNDISEIWSLNQCFLSRNFEIPPEFIISEIWSLNQCFLSRNFEIRPEYVILKIWSLQSSPNVEISQIGHFRRQSLFSVRKCRNWTRTCPFLDFKPQSQLQ